jgi:hypothetical protein
MTRLLTDGFEGGDLNLYQTIVNFVNSTTVVRSGARSLYGSSAAATCMRDFTASSAVYVRVGWYTIAGGVNGHIFTLRKGTTVICTVVSNVDGSFSVFVSTATLAFTTAVGLWVTSTHYLLELYLNIADAAGTLTLKVDGIQRGTFSGDTKPGADTQVDRISFQNNSAYNFYIDDFGLNDTAGGVDDSWLGDGKIIGIKPNAAGNYTQWTPSAGSNWQNVDEVPHTSDTDYNSESLASDKDSYNLEACGLTSVTIKRAWIEMVARNTVADGSQARMFLRAGGTDYNDSVGARTLTASYARYVSGQWTTDPSDAAAWTTADLDALEAGIEVI